LSDTAVLPSVSFDSVFPHEYRPRAYQKEIIEYVQKIFESKRIGFLNAPCGTGKTISALVGYFLAKGLHGRDNVLVVLTRTKSQALIFEKEIKAIMRSSGVNIPVAILLSKQEMCPLLEPKKEKISYAEFLKKCLLISSSGHCPYHNTSVKNGEPSQVAKDVIEIMLNDQEFSPSEVYARSVEQRLCPYDITQFMAKGARVIIASYNYLLDHKIQNYFIKGLDIDIGNISLIIDEAHNLPEVVRNLNSTSITLKDIEQAIEEGKSLGIDMTDLVALYQFLQETGERKLRGKTEDDKVQVELWEIIPRFIKEESLRKLIESGSSFERKKFEEGSFVVSKLVEVSQFYLSVLSHVDSSHIIVVQWYRKRERIPKLTLMGLDSAEYISPLLTSVDSALLMSGTFDPLNYYSDVLGVPMAVKMSFPSPYSSRNRLLLVDPELSMNYNMRTESLWESYAERIALIVRNLPRNKSVLVSYPSYKIKDNIERYLVKKVHRRILSEKRGAKLEDLKAELARGKPVIVSAVAGGKWTEGVEFRINGESAISSIIIAGIPFPLLDEINEKLKEFYDARFHNGFAYAIFVPALKKLFQVSGRLIRSEKDRGVVIVLDKRLKTYREFLPKTWKQEIWAYESAQELVDALKYFFRRRP